MCGQCGPRPTSGQGEQQRYLPGVDEPQRTLSPSRWRALWFSNPSLSQRLDEREKAELSWESLQVVRSLVQRWRLSSSTSVDLESVCNPSLIISFRSLSRFLPVFSRASSEATRRVSSPKVTTLTSLNARHWKVSLSTPRNQRFVLTYRQQTLGLSCLRPTTAISSPTSPPPSPPRPLLKRRLRFSSISSIS